MGPTTGALIVLATVAAGIEGWGVAWWSVDGGGGASSSPAGWAVEGTIGQPEAGLLAGGAWALDGGFWPGPLAATPPACPADVDRDGEVSASDLAILLGSWGTFDPAIDLDGNGAVDAGDLAILLGAWGGC